jgi:hypothetical protein
MKAKATLLKAYAKGLVRSYGKQKIFCVGLNKTGTTSLGKALENLGMAVAPQHLGEPLVYDWARRDFRRIVRLCRFFQAFQDVPFSLPFTFQAVDMACPRSKFILTVRQNADQWCQSLIRFHSKVFGRGNLPTIEDLKVATCSYPGYAFDAYMAAFSVHGTSLYQPEMLRQYYEAHNAAVTEYFRHRPKDLLVLDVSTPNAFADLCRFLGKEESGGEFPWENRTDDFLCPSK